MPDSLQKKRKILIVEDDIENQDLLRAILSASCAVSVCTTAEQALKVLDKERFDLYILDINLYGMTGFVVLDKIAQLGRLEETPVVFCSSQFDERIKEEALSRGASGFIEKPYRMDSVLSVVKTLMPEAS